MINRRRSTIPPYVFAMHALVLLAMLGFLLIARNQEAARVAVEAPCVTDTECGALDGPGGHDGGPEPMQWVAQ